MQFKPKTEDELNADRLAPGNVYDFEVINAADAISKKGNEMIALELSVYTPSGKVRQLKDWLVSAMEHKLRHACYSLGLGQKYEDGTLTAADCIGRSGKLTVKAEKNEGYDQPRMVVADYVVGNDVAKASPSAAAQPKAPAPAAGADEPPF